MLVAPLQVGAVQPDAPDNEIRREEQALKRLPQQFEFVETPGSVPDNIAREQALCMADQYGLIVSQNRVAIRNSPSLTQMTLIPEDDKYLIISIDDHSGVLVSRCACDPKGDYLASGMRRSTIIVTSMEASVTVSTYVSTDTPGSHLDLFATVSPPNTKYTSATVTYNLKASAVADGSLAHAADTLLTSGTISAHSLGGEERRITAEQVEWVSGVLRHALGAAARCHIINYGGG
jgi:hypothetical protein